MEIPCQTALDLTADGYLRDEVEYVQPPFETFGRQSDVDLRLARAGDSVQEDVTAGCKVLSDICRRCFLFGREDGKVRPADVCRGCRHDACVAV